MSDNFIDLMNNIDGENTNGQNPYENAETATQQNHYAEAYSYVYTSGWMNTNSQQPTNQVQYTVPTGGGYYYVPAQYAAPVLPKTEKKGLAIAGMICGILSIVLCCVTTDLAVPGLIMSIAAVAKKYKGRGMAIAGIICSSLGLILSLGFFGVLLLEMY